MDDSVLSVVIPVFNEEPNLRPLCEELRFHLERISRPYEVILVDDGSTDGTAASLREISCQWDRLRFLRFRRRCGQTAALDAGFRASRGDVVVTMDGDLQNDPADLPGLLDRLSGCDAVVGWRAVRRDSWVKRVSTRIANSVRNRLSGDQIRDTGCSMKAYRRHCLERLPLFDGMHRFLPTLIRMEGFRVEEIQVNHRFRVHGQTKYNIRNRLFRSFLDLLAVRWMRNRKLRYEILENDS